MTAGSQSVLVIMGAKIQSYSYLRWAYRHLSLASRSHPADIPVPYQFRSAAMASMGGK